MHKHKRYRYGPPMFRPFRGGWIWLIIMAVLFSGGGKNWWPMILIVIGLFILVGSFRERRPPEEPGPPPHFDPPPFHAPPPAPRPAPPAQASFQRPGLLPATCPRCGGPVRTSEVKWSGDQAACAYCGANLPAKS
ncbi:MAG TPA: hypothetical protein PK989_10465 [Anaerolineales bacterium]|nr:hypothetical protein [Anaerolineales bacterium]